MLTTTKYSDIEEINKLAQNHINDVFIVHMNAVSLVANFDKITLFLEKISFPDIICVSETRLKDEKIDFQKHLISIPNYDLIFDNSPTNAGGVAIFVKNELKYQIRQDIRLNVDGCESIFLHLESFSRNSCVSSLLIGCVYRHPKPSSLHFVEELLEKLHSFSLSNTP